MPTPPQDIVGVILAGGLSSRMQYRDKALLPLGGKPLIAHIIENAQTQTGRLLLNVNRAPERYASFGLPVLGDDRGEGAGPIAGLAAAMDHCVREDQVNRHAGRTWHSA